jgi:ADP-heptose:LPS heptosyltransferase
MGEPDKILLIQLYSNGDCLYATSVAKQIKQDYPGCHLTWAIADYCKDIIANNPYVDERLIIKDINHSNWKQYLEKFKQQVNQWKHEKRFDKIVFTQILDSNFSNYDYCIRSSIFRGYDRQITVDIQPVLELTEDEKNQVDDFAKKNLFQNYSQIILVEFSPRSGQANFPVESALSLAKRLVADPSIAVILSSNQPINDIHKSIIDGSVLSLRQTAHLSKYCTLLIGCSSGITWVTTSTAGKKLPMVQILNPNAYWFNPVINDHARFGLPTDYIIELSDSVSEEIIFTCVSEIIKHGFENAKKLYQTEMPLQFRITRGIICYLLGKGKVRSAFKHIKINLKLFGWNFGLIKSIFLGVTTFPIINFLNKRKELHS